MVLGGPPPGTWRLVYASGLYVSAPEGSIREKGADWIYSTLNQKSSSNEIDGPVTGRGSL